MRLPRNSMRRWIVSESNVVTISAPSDQWFEPGWAG